MNASTRTGSSRWTRTSPTIPPLLRPFLVEHPEVVIDLREHPTSEIASAVNKGVADIGLIVGVSPGGDQQRISSWADHLVLVVPAAAASGPVWPKPVMRP